MILAFLRQPDTLEKLNANFTDLISQLLLLQISVGADTKNFANSLIDFYLGGNAYVNVTDSESVQGFINVSFIIIIVKTCLKSMLSSYIPIERLSMQLIKL